MRQFSVSDRSFLSEDGELSPRVSSRVVILMYATYVVFWKSLTYKQTTRNHLVLEGAGSFLD